MRRAVLLLLALAIMAPQTTLAGQSKRAKKMAESGDKGSQQAQQDKKKGPFKPFDEVTDGMERRQGFFDLYEKPGALYMAVPEDRLGEPFLMSFELAQGLARSGVNSGSMLDWEGRIVAFERHGNTLYLMHRPHRFVATQEDEQAVVEGSFGSSVLASAKILSQRDDKALLFDVEKWFVSDMAGVGQWLRFVVSPRRGQPGRVQFDKSRSFVEAVKVFPKNINVRTKLTFRPGQPVNFNSVPDSRYLPLSVYCVMAELPENPMEPRVADDRVGYFLTVHKDYSKEQKTFFQRYVRRWRLEKGKKHGNLYAPKKPIIYYLDRNIPAKYRPYIQAGLEEWNVAFEEAGWKNAIQADLLPREAEAEDMRYPTIRWTATDQNGYLAIGPSVVDPRTGEVLDADILFDAVMPLAVSNTWKNIVDPATAVEQMFEAYDVEMNHNALQCALAGHADQLAMQAGVVVASLLARGDMKPGDPVPEEFLGEFLKFVTMHEVGHTLGLRHNFRGSIDTPMSKLHDRMWTSENGLVNSVMEYPAPNVAAGGQANGHWYTPTVGRYDRWAIAYGYTPDPARAEELARLGAQHGHAYGTDEDARGIGALDPTVNVWDLGEDPLAWGEERAAIVRELWQTLPQNVLVDDAPRYELTNALNVLIGAYGQALAPAVKYLGGQYVYRDHVGDPGAHAPFVPVPRAKQEAALRHLTMNAFGEKAFDLPREVLSQLGPQRWSHWGMRNTIAGRIDYPLHWMVLGMQNALLNQILHPYRFARISDSEEKFGADQVVTIHELMDELTAAVWSEVWSGSPRNINSMRRNLQRLYVDRMTGILTQPRAGMPPDVRAVTRQELKDLRSRVAKAAQSGAIDTYTKAHLAEVRERIDKALEAGLEVEMLGGARL